MKLCGWPFKGSRNKNSASNNSMSIQQSGNGSKVTINGITYTGNNVSIVNDKVTIDGVVQHQKLVGEINVSVKGTNIESVTTSSGDIYIEGPVGSVRTTSGDVDCGNVAGNVQTVSGDVSAYDIKGNVNTVSGDIG